MSSSSSSLSSAIDFAVGSKVTCTLKNGPKSSTIAVILCHTDGSYVCDLTSFQTDANGNSPAGAGFTTPNQPSGAYEVAYKLGTQDLVIYPFTIIAAPAPAVVPKLTVNIGGQPIGSKAITSDITINL
jgi:hypothetical protein